MATSNGFTTHELTALDLSLTSNRLDEIASTPSPIFEDLNHHEIQQNQITSSECNSYLKDGHPWCDLHDFNQPSAVNKVATVLWQDGPLTEGESFICIKLMEASQARSYIHLIGTPRKNLHLTGGKIEKIVSASSNPMVSINSEHFFRPANTVSNQPQMNSSNVIDRRNTTPNSSTAITGGAHQQQLASTARACLRPLPPLVSLSIMKTAEEPNYHRGSVTSPSRQQEQPYDLSRSSKGLMLESRIQKLTRTMEKQFRMFHPYNNGTTHKKS